MPWPSSSAAQSASRLSRAMLAVLVCSSLAARPSPPQDATPAQDKTTPQDPSAEARAALLRTMMVLKIAPYLSREGSEQPDDKTPFRIAVVGDDDTVVAIQRHLPSKDVGKRPIAVESLTAEAAVITPKPPRFDLIFLAHDLDAKALAAIVAAHEKSATVLVCERAGFAKAGGGVQLFIESNGLRFEVNADALKKQGIRASHQLLKLSKPGPQQ